MGLHPNDFADPGNTPNQGEYIVLDSGRLLSEVPVGYLVAFNNDDYYNKLNREGYDWPREVALKTGVDQFDAWGMSPSSGQTAASIINRLYNEYNDGIPWWPQLPSDHFVPGFQGLAWYINIPMIGQMIFNERTGQTPPPQ